MILNVYTVVFILFYQMRFVAYLSTNMSMSTFFLWFEDNIEVCSSVCSFIKR